MDETLRLVGAFHRAFGIKTPEVPTRLTAPAVVSGYVQEMRALAEDLWIEAAVEDKNEALLRLQLLQEELYELADAIAQGDLVAALDALCDLRYVLDGTVHSLGLQHVFLDAFREVHRSNMSKLDIDGRALFNSAGRVVKGPNYEPPRLRTFVEERRKTG